MLSCYLRYLCCKVKLSWWGQSFRLTNSSLETDCKFRWVYMNGTLNQPPSTDNLSDDWWKVFIGEEFNIIASDWLGSQPLWVKGTPGVSLVRQNKRDRDKIRESKSAPFGKWVIHREMCCRLMKPHHGQSVSQSGETRSNWVLMKTASHRVVLNLPR